MAQQHYEPLDMSLIDPALSHQEAPGYTTPVDSDDHSSLLGVGFHQDLQYLQHTLPNQNAPPYLPQIMSWAGQTDIVPFQANQDHGLFPGPNHHQALNVDTAQHDHASWSSLRDDPISALSANRSAYTGDLWLASKDTMMTESFGYGTNFGTPSQSSYPPLSHHNSSASLSSLLSHSNENAFGQSHQLGSSYPGLLVDTPNEYQSQQSQQTFYPPQSMSRQSSCASFTSSAFTSSDNQQYPYLPTNHGYNPVPISNFSLYETPLSRQGNTLTTPNKSGRQRSSSRVQPYTRHGRSSSTASSSFASIDAYGEEAQTPLNTFRPAPTTISPTCLSKDMNKVSLHHRRTSSRSSVISTIKKVPSTARLSRSGRSASMSVLKAEPFDWSDAPPIPAHAALQEEARRFQAITSIAQQDKARTMWVRKWLQLAYTSAPVFTVPRQGLHYSYSQACLDYGMGPPINAASFGKAVRAAYPGIRTRRLGVRGDSKYHYQSLRPALAIECQRLNDFGNTSGHWFASPNGGPIEFRSNPVFTQGVMHVHEEEAEEEDDDSEVEEDDTSLSYHHRTPSLDFFHPVKTEQHARHGSGSMELAPAPQRPRAAFPRRHTTSVVKHESPHIRHSQIKVEPKIYDEVRFPQIEDVLAACPDENEGDIRSFWTGFCQHQQDLVSCIASGAYDAVEAHCRNYWGDLPEISIRLCHDSQLSNCISTAMALTYDHIVDTLLASVTRPASFSNQRALKDLGLNLEETMELSLADFEGVFKHYKVELTVRVAHMMTRLAALCQLSGTMVPILTDGEVIRRMKNAWSTLDTKTISDQCALALSCDQELLDRIFIDMAGYLHRIEEMSTQGEGGAKALDKLAKWLDSVLLQMRAGSEHPDGVMARVPAKVAFVTSQVMRQLTLDSHPAFGQFQLLKTWIEDYISIISVKNTCLVPDPAASSTAMGSLSGLSVAIPPIQAGRGADLATAVPLPSLPVSNPYSLAANNDIDHSLLEPSSQLAPPTQDFRMGTPTPVGQSFPSFSFPT